MVGCFKHLRLFFMVMPPLFTGRLVYNLFHRVSFLALIFLSALLTPASFADTNDWFSFVPTADKFVESPIDLRSLNEAGAGEHGPIAVKDGHFIYSGNGQ